MSAGLVTTGQTESNSLVLRKRSKEKKEEDERVKINRPLLNEHQRKCMQN